MNVLSMECSSPKNSMALFKDGVLVGESGWDAGRKTGTILFEELERMLNDAQIKAAELNEIVVGKGPGNFSGMRIAMSAAQGLAFPLGIPLVAISSGEAMAFKNKEAFDKGLVIGDARRDQCWLAIFNSCPQFEQSLEWSLCGFEETNEKIKMVDNVYSSEAVRLAEHLALDEENFISAYPKAEDLLALQQYKKGQPLSTETFEPLYMHPAVS